MDAPAAEPAISDRLPPSRTHDVYFTTSAGRFYIRNPNHGVTLKACQLVWTFGGKTDGAPFENIVEVRLESGGSWQAPLSLCHIAFADRYKLTVSNGNDLGFRNEQQRGRYRDFVHDLHARLAAHAATRAAPPITFGAGYSAGRHHLLLVLTVLMTLITIGMPLVALLITREMQPLMLLVFGAIFIWPLWQMMQNNAPRAYEPAKLPTELMG